MAYSKKDNYEAITNELIEAMSGDSWKSGMAGIASGMPMNDRGNYYSGINILLLWISSNKNGFGSNRWMTYKQAQAKGGFVRKGEKGTRIIFYKTLEKENKETGKTDKIPMLRTYTVFNLDQIEGVDAPAFEGFEWDAIEAGEHLIDSSECEIQEANCVPCYIPSKDVIKMPAKQHFETAENYYSTAAHEMIHSTMHKDRCDRSQKTSTRDYAYEELIAELGAVFTCSMLGIKGNTENHASYLESWLKAMASDKKYIFQAATAASKAANYLIDNMNNQQAEQAA